MNDGMRYYVCQRYIRMNMGINGLYKLVAIRSDLKEVPSRYPISTPARRLV